MSLTLNRAEICLLRLAFWEANADAKAFAAGVAERLRILAPGIQARLPKSLEHCVREVMVEIEAALMVAHEEDELRRATDHLAARYHKYHLPPIDVHMFRESLLLALEARSTRSFDAARRAIWRRACADLSAAVVQASCCAQPT